MGNRDAPSRFRPESCCPTDVLDARLDAGEVTAEEYFARPPVSTARQQPAVMEVRDVHR